MFFANLPVEATGCWWWLGLLLLGFLIGVVTGLFGIGGGFLLTPALKIFFNVPYPIAIGSGLTHILINTVFSAHRHWRQKNVDTKLGFIMAGGSIIGAECGVRFLKIVSEKGTVAIGGNSIQYMDLLISVCFLVLMAVVAVFTLYESMRSETEEVQTVLGQMLRRVSIPPLLTFERSNIANMSAWIPVTLSFFVGCLTGLLGIGGGFINFPLMIYLIGVPTRLAVGTSTFQVLFVSLYCVFRYLQQGNVDFILVFVMLIGSLAGVHIGVKLCLLTEARNLRKYFAGLLLVAILIISYHLFNSVFGR